MSALAMLSSELGAWVSGSDRQNSAILEKLRSNGINAYVGSDIVVVAGSDLVVYTGAISDDNEELKFARANKIRCMERKAFLALMSKQCDSVVAIAGSHGKTTTTAMLCWVAKNMSLNFIGHLGGIINQEDSNYINTGNDYFITEACEYNKSFLSLSPNIGVILNCDYDHPDTYPTVESMYDAFRQFAIESKVVLVGEESYNILRLEGIDDSNDKVYTFGFGEKAHFRACNITQKEGRYSFDVVFKGKKLTRVALGLPGKHNVLNALCVIAICQLLWLDTCKASKYIEEFQGVERRFNVLGKGASGCEIIADYAHHPKEISATIDTIRLMTKGRIIAIFEPHTYSRTKALLEDFGGCFYWADEVIVLPTYSAREDVSQGMSGIELVCYMNQKGQCALYLDDYQKAKEYIEKHTKDSDIAVFLGAGSIYDFAKELAEQTKQ